MHSSSVYTILLTYLKQRSTGDLDTESIKNDLAKIGKNQGEIYDILIEFDDEWDRDLLHRKLMKKAEFNVIIGCILAIGAGTFCILSAVNMLSFQGFTIIPYGLVASGIFAALMGWNYMKTAKIREKRLKLKYQNW